MKTLLMFFVLVSSTNLVFSQNKIVGKWLTEDKEAVIQIFEKEGKFYGTIIWLKEPNDSKGNPLTDTENPDKKSQKQPLIGLKMLKDFTFQDGEWTGGTVYDPDNGKTYKCKLWLEGNNVLKMRGYLGLVYSTETWTRKQ